MSAAIFLLYIIEYLQYYLRLNIQQLALYLLKSTGRQFYSGMTVKVSYTQNFIIMRTNYEYDGRI